jgi:hypothetical protein
MKGKSSIWIVLVNVERKDAEFSGPQILGSRILCHDCWPGRGNDPGLYPKPRTGRSAIEQLEPEDFVTAQNPNNRPGISLNRLCEP